MVIILFRVEVCGENFCIVTSVQINQQQNENVGFYYGKQNYRSEYKGYIFLVLKEINIRSAREFSSLKKRQEEPFEKVRQFL